MANPYFNWYNNDASINPESTLYNNLSDECIEMFGIQCLYMPRKARKPDMLFGENAGDYFVEGDSFEITMYLEDPISFSEDEMYTKFGISVDNKVTLFVQQDRIIDALDDEVPFFGDLIYIPMFNRLFEVTNPEEKNTFFLFGRLMTYAIKCELIKYGQEEINVGVSEVDSLLGTNAVVPELNDNLDDSDADVVATINFDEENPFG